MGEEEETDDLNFIIQAFSDVISSSCLMVLLQFQQQNKSLFSFRDAVEMEFPEESVEKRYLLQLFHYNPASSHTGFATASSRWKNATIATTTASSSSNSMNDDKDDNNNPALQISQIFPNYGLGYIETALACYG